VIGRRMASALIGLGLGIGLAGPALAQGQSSVGQPPAQAPVQAVAPGGDAEPWVMLVLDGSGSMWGKLGKDQKINAVRDVLKLALPKAPPMNLGLTAYGHRRTGDCSDVEVAVPLAKANAERLATYLEKYNPKGKGPLGNALKAAAEAFGEKASPAARGARRSLIVITDNADNCKVDTCELAQELRQSQPGLMIHVIALGVSKDETVPLACLATATGGRLFAADGAADIASAVEQSFKLATAGSAIVTPASPGGTAQTGTQTGAQTAALQQAPGGDKPAAKKPAAETAGPPGLRLTALLAAGGAEITNGIRWRVTDAAGKGSERRVVYEGEDPAPGLDLPPGAYRVEATFGLASVEQALTVGAVGRTHVQVPLNAGVINVKDSGARNGSSTDRVFYTLYAAAAGPKDKPRALALSSDSVPVYNVAAGTYLIAVQQGLARIERSVTISAGAVTDVDIPLYLGEMRLSAVATEGSAPLDRVLFQVFEDDPDAPGGLRELVRSSAPRPEFSLPAGSYHVIARHDGAEARELLSIKPGARTTKTLVLASGQLTMSLRLPPRTQGRLEPELISYRIERLGAPRPAKSEQRPDGRGEEVSRVQSPEHALALKAGKYRVESRYGAINARTVREVEVKAGAAQTLALEMEAGLVTLKLAAQSAGKTAAAPAAPSGAEVRSDVHWEILDASGRTIWSTGQPSPRLPLAAGRYTARAETRTQKADQQFQVASGDDKTIEIELK
jgi:Ca-activated chloride channel homolog